VKPALSSEHVSVWQWIGLYCLNIIPVVGSLTYLVLLFVFAFGKTPKKTLKNWAKAQLIIALVALVLVTAGVVIVTSLFGGWINDVLNEFVVIT
ncbi:MAG: hypothetical protein FWD16_06580, partial [Clostridia bacterium]|nr:hypothetical protein [Clostridia bacterium]